MKTTAIVCALLAGNLGLGSVAIADDGWRDRDSDRRDRFEQRQDWREARQQRREHRREIQAYRHDRHDREEHGHDGYRAGVRTQPGYVYTQPSYVYSQPSYSYSQPSYSYSQPSYVYSQPSYNSYHQPRFYRGGYLPAEYRGSQYHVNNWNAYPGLYSPPYGHQWVNTGSNFLLVAVATGLIANLLTH